MIINNINIETQYGIRAGKTAYSEMEKFADPKKGYEYSYSDENGTEKDPNEVPVFERKTYQIPLTLIANNLTDFLSKKRGFEQLVYGLKEFNLDIPFLNRRWQVKYAGVTGLSILNIHNRDGKMVCKFTLSMTDDYPTNFFPII